MWHIEYWYIFLKSRSCKFDQSQISFHMSWLRSWPWTNTLASRKLQLENDSFIHLFIQHLLNSPCVPRPAKENAKQPGQVCSLCRGGDRSMGTHRRTTASCSGYGHRLTSDRAGSVIPALPLVRLAWHDFRWFYSVLSDSVFSSLNWRGSQHLFHGDVWGLNDGEILWKGLCDIDSDCHSPLAYGK